MPSCRFVGSSLKGERGEDPRWSAVISLGLEKCVGILYEERRNSMIFKIDLTTRIIKILVCGVDGSN